MTAPYGSIQLISGEKPLPLVELSITTEIAGSISNTVVDLAFSNPENKTVEGELDFPLPENAVVCGYAYEFQGHMVPASVVEKEQARITFEKEVRSGGATSLVEHVKGNSFKVRVYPINPSSVKRVSLEFMSDLVSSNGKTNEFSLPIKLTDNCKVGLNLTVQKIAEKPTLDCNLGLDFTKEGDKWKAKSSFGSSKLEKLSIQIPNEKKCEVLIGDKDLAHKGMETYFSILDYVADPSNSNVRKPIKNVLIMWDASFSYVDIDRTREINFIQSLCKESTKIDLVVFRNVAEPVISFENAESIVDYLKSAVLYDGGTDMENLKFPTGSYDKIFMFTDGLSTLSGDLPTQVPKSPVFIFVNSPKNNIKYLQFFASKTGGMCFNLPNYEDDEVIDEVSKPNKFCFLSATFDNKKITDVLPSNPVVLVGDEGFKVVGKLVADEAEISLNFGYDSSKVLVTKKFTLKKNDSVGISDIVPRSWAQRKVDELSLIDNEENKKLMLKIGRKFGLVTPNASLLVLTTLDQYLKYDIEPSKDALPQLHDEFTQRRKQNEKDEQTKRNNKISKVKSWWNDRKNWWNKDHTSAQKDFVKQNWMKKNPDPPALRPPPGPHTAKLTEKDAKAKLEADAKKPSVHQVTESAPSRSRSLARKSSAENEEKAEMKDALSDASEEEMEKDEAPMEKMEKSKKKKSVMKDKASEKEMKSAAPLKKMMAPSSSMGPGGGGGPSPKLSLSKSESGAPEPAPDAPTDSGSTIGVSIKSWTPNVPYLREIQSKPGKEEQYKEYIKQRAGYSQSPAFYLDCCTYFFNAKFGDLGVRIITTIADMKLEDHRLLRIIANQLLQQGVLEQALWLFNAVVKMRPEEPQSHRELAMILAEKKEFQKALETYYKVITTEWPVRFQHIEDEVLMEINRTIWLAKKEKVEVDTKFIDPAFLVHMPTDVKLVISWDQDDLCIDLHIFEPNGQKSYYGSYMTSLGGWSSPDYPGCTAYSTSMLREYMIRNGVPGEYIVCANMYSNYKQDLTGGTTIWFTVYTNYMKENEQKTYTVLRITEASPVPTYNSMKEIGRMQYQENENVKKWIGELEPESKKKWAVYNEANAKRTKEWETWEKEEAEIKKSNENMLEKVRNKK